MRRTRRLLLLAILVILVVVGVAFYTQKRLQQASAPPPPKVLPPDTSAAAEYWSWSLTQQGKPVVEVRAANYRQIREPSRFDLEKVELRIFDKDGKNYDEVRSAFAQFDIKKGILYSEGEVEIKMSLPSGKAPGGRLINIRSSGVTFESKTGKAYTDKPTTFTFDRGDGKCVGATYDPELRELHMLSAAEVNWQGKTDKAEPMKIEAGDLLYKERDSVVLLGPWSRFTRGGTVLDAAASVVFLKEGAIDRVEAKEARGTDQRENRRSEYAASQVYMTIGNSGEIEKIEGEGSAKLVSTSKVARTTINTDRVDLYFDTASGGSALRTATAKGHSVVESAPRNGAGQTSPSLTRVLRSEVIEMTMAPGGREIAAMETGARGTIEFLPGSAAQRRRKLDADKIHIDYAPGNRIRELRASNASTETESKPKGGKKQPPVLTASKDFRAIFDPPTGKMVRLEQWGDFHYEEGERHGRAERATLEGDRNIITLDQSARFWDPAGSTAADRIILDQESGDVTAQGKVASTQLPDSKKTTAGPLSSGQSVQALAQRMFVTGRNRYVRYEGDAVVWQGGNRIRGDVVQIDRQQRVLKARGNVVTQFIDQPADNVAAAKKPRSPMYTIVRAPELEYSDETGTAHYSGGVQLNRSGIDVKSAELNAMLVQGDTGSRLDKAVADGSVRIVHSARGRTRTATGEHAVYSTTEEKVVVSGGSPLLVDSKRGSTSGTQLTWFANSDRLLVDGREDRPAVSRILRK
ncbi:MAG: LPS export ABC transporter periplasmic protein LptC [Bryobacteraceae bacterium]